MTDAMYAARIEAIVQAIDQRLDRIELLLDEHTAPPMLIKPRRKRLAKILQFRHSRT